MKTSYDIINSAFRKLGQLGETETMTTFQVTNGAKVLSSMANAFVALGLPPWNLALESIPLSNFLTDDSKIIGQSSTNPVPDIFVTYAPLRINGAWREINGTRYELEVQARNKMLNKFNQLMTGSPNSLYFQPLTADRMEITIYPKPDATWTTGNLLIDYQYHVETQYYNPTTELPNFPVHWEEALIYNLALRLAPEYGLSTEERQNLSKEAAEALKLAVDFTNEEGSLFLVPRKR